jgi:hypothetical protein
MSQTRREGDRVGGSLVRRKHSGWRCSLPRRESLDLSKEVKALLAEMSPFSDAIRQECERQRLSSELACVLHVGSPTPAAHFDLETLKVIVELGAAIDLDLYLEPSNW